MLSHSIPFGNDRSEPQLIDDLSALCKRHKIHCGGSSDLTHLPSDLSNDNFRTDLFSLCTAISHMAETDLSPQQLLVLVARAVGGPEASIENIDDLPSDAASTFIEGYERWTQRDPAEDDLPIDRRHDAISPESTAGPYYTAATLSSSYLFAMHDDPVPLPARRAIPPGTPLENLTLNELRTYLEDIENRVRRIGPQLDRIALEAVPPTPLPEALLTQPATENEAVAFSPAASITDDHDVVPPDLTGPQTPASPSLHAISPPTDSLPVLPPPTKTASLTKEAAHLHRLRIFNAVLAGLLLLVCTATAFFAYRYLHPRTQPSANALHEPSPAAAQTPADHKNPAQISSAPSPTPSFPQAKIHPPEATAPKKTVTPSTSSTSSKETTSRHESSTPPQVETAKASPPAKNPIETSAPPHPSQPAPAPSAADHQDHATPKTALSPAAIDTARASERTAAPTITPSIAANKSIPTPPDTTAPLTHPPHPPDSPVAVPSSTMMAYAIAMPKPNYPAMRYASGPSTVELAVSISKEGKVTGSRALSGSIDVTTAAQRAVQSWRFKPFLLNGNPVEVVTTFRFVFSPD